MSRDLTPEQRRAIRDAVSGARTHGDAMQALAPVIAQMLADERERIAREIEALPTTRTQAWLKGWDSISLADATAIARQEPTA